MIELGTGQLTWNTFERRTDRYGSVALMDDAKPGGSGKQIQWAEGAAEMAGAFGYLVAYVIETRKSDHIGDLFRGIAPEKPEVDEVIELGPGELFFEEMDGTLYVGLTPLDGRPNDWLDPHDLYRLHQQTVRLAFALDEDHE